MAAVSALEARSKEFVQEREQKKQLEVKESFGIGGYSIEGLRHIDIRCGVLLK